ncbi:MAG: orotate phosphoribosyltransferase [Gemmatimonadota bacterium]
MVRSEDLKQLHLLLRERSVERGDFILASGKRSSYYVDARLTTMSGRGQLLIGRLGLALIDEAAWKADAVGGLTLGADPIAYAIAHEAALQGRALDAFTVRKEAKAHGAGKLVEGSFAAGMSVVIVEDVITTGDSALRAARTIAEADGHVLGILAVVDREEGGRERIEAAGFAVRALAQVGDLLA